MSKELRLRSRFEYTTSALGVVIFTFYWGVIATYPEFYFVSPLGEPTPRAIALVLLILGWVSISTVAPMILFQFGSGRYRIIRALPFTVAIWPLSILVGQVERLISTGQSYLSYLLETPLFIATDFLIPIVLLSLWLRLRLHHLD